MLAIKCVLLRAKNNLIGKLVSKIKQTQPLLSIGPNSALNLCDDIKRFGEKKVLIITDEVLLTLGVISPMVERLESLDIAVSVYSGVQPDPTWAQVREGIAQAKSEGCDAILGVGGGSVLDAAKAISAGAVIEADVTTLEGFLKVKKSPLALYCVPSTSGTAAEVSMAAVISDPDTHEKSGIVSPKLICKIAALDPIVLRGMPPHITAATGADALTHAVESFISRNAKPESDELARTAIKLVFENFEQAYKQGDDLQARQSMAIASTYAGLAFGKTFVGYVHAISHAIGAKYGIAHGLANAIILPHVLRYSLPEVEARLAELAVLVGLGQLSESQAQLAQKFVDGVQALLDTLDIPRGFSQLQDNDMDFLATEALEEAHRVYNVPRYMDKKACLAMLSALKV